MTSDPYEREAAKAALHTQQREIQRLRKRVAELETIHAAAVRLKKAKGRYLTEQAANHLLSLLP